MYRSRGWYKVKHGGGSMIFTYEGGHGNYTLNDFATYNKGVLSLNCYVRDCGDIDEHQTKRRLSDYFRQYGKRIVVAEKNGKRNRIGCRVEAHFLYPQLPTEEKLGEWFTDIASNVKDY